MFKELRKQLSASSCVLSAFATVSPAKTDDMNRPKCPLVVESGGPKTMDPRTPDPQRKKAGFPAY